MIVIQNEPGQENEEASIALPDRKYLINRYQYGVNIGGWLVLEKWMTPELFGSAGEGEHGFLKYHQSASKNKLFSHWNTWMTENDIIYLAQRGVNSLRIPIGYWFYPKLMESSDPFYPYSYVYLDEKGNSIPEQFLIKLLRWTEKYGVGVVLCCHGAYGGQNGQHHSGVEGRYLWFSDEKYRNQTHTFLLQLTRNFHPKVYPSVIGLELLNEPLITNSNDFSILSKWYTNEFNLLRVESPDIEIIFSDGFQLENWKQLLPFPANRNVVQDTHHYPIHDSVQNKLSFFNLLTSQGNFSSKLNSVADIYGSARTIIVGEWCLSLSNENQQGLDARQRELAVIAFANSQMIAFENSTSGHYFWSYKLSFDGYYHWSFAKCIEKGWLKPFRSVSYRYIDISPHLKKASLAHKKKWNCPDEELWHFDAGYQQGWKEQEAFVKVNCHVGRRAELAESGRKSHVNHWLGLGVDYSKQSWRYYHGFIEGLRDLYVLL